MAFQLSRTILNSQALSAKSQTKRWQVTNSIGITRSPPSCRATPRLATRPLSEWSTRRCRTKRATCLGKNLWSFPLQLIMGRQTFPKKFLPPSSIERRCCNSRQTTNNSVLWDHKAPALEMLMGQVQIRLRCIQQTIRWRWLNSSQWERIQKIVRKLSSSTVVNYQT